MTLTPGSAEFLNVSFPDHLTHTEQCSPYSQKHHSDATAKRHRVSDSIEFWRNIITERARRGCIFQSKSRRSEREPIRAIVFISERETLLLVCCHLSRETGPANEWGSVLFSFRRISFVLTELRFLITGPGWVWRVTTIWPDAFGISGLKVLIKVQIGVMKQTLNSVLWEFIRERMHRWDILVGHNYNIINTDSIFRVSSDGPSNRRSTIDPVLKTSNAPSRG